VTEEHTWRSDIAGAEKSLWWTKPACGPKPASKAWRDSAAIPVWALRECTALNALTSPGFWWFYRVTTFWGFGFLKHGLDVFTHGRFLQKPGKRKKSGSISRRKK